MGIRRLVGELSVVRIQFSEFACSIGGGTHSHGANRACVSQVVLFGARQGSTADAAALNRDYATASASEAILARRLQGRTALCAGLGGSYGLTSRSGGAGSLLPGWCLTHMSPASVQSFSSSLLGNWVYRGGLLGQYR